MLLFGERKKETKKPLYTVRTPVITIGCDMQVIFQKKRLLK